MWPFPDTGELYAIAARISTHADHARLRAARLHRHVQHLQWHGSAADAFTPLAANVEQALRETGARLDAAATHLRSHAQSVEDTARRLQDLAVEAGLDIVEVMQANEQGSLALLDAGGDAVGSVLRHGGAGLLGSVLGIGS
ncbi:MAG: WXG100 family type VII secretion target [Jatrophihabitans sp.]